MSLFISVILLSSLCCVNMQKFRSSYFKISPQEEEADFTTTKQVHDEFSCASLCSSTVLCHYALFDKDSKQCSFAKEAEKLNQQDGEEPKGQKILLEKISSQEDLDEEDDFTIDTQVHDEFSCASLCSSTVMCRYALIDKHSKKCTFVKATEKLTIQDGEELESEKILLEKVDVAPNSKQDSCVSVEKDKPCTAYENNQTKVPSCSSILDKNSSSPTGIYRITVGDNTWPRRCEMMGVEGCGNGAWELVMRIKGGRNKSSYVFKSRRWTDKRVTIRWESNSGKQVKFPAYWLSSFTRICVTMNFAANLSRNATSILMNYTAPSLHSVLHSGATKTWAANLSTIKTPPKVDKSCLVQGFNMVGPHPWTIKSRIGVETQPQNRCSIPYLVRGVGIGFQEYPYLSCGEIIIGYSVDKKTKVEIYPALCTVYIQ